MTHIEKSILVDASAERVWGVFADFGGVDDWHPYFQNAYLDPPTPTSGIGASRICEFGPKMAIRETVRTWEENHMVIGIDFLKGPPSPLRDIVAAVRVEPQGDGARLTLLLDYAIAWGLLGWLLDVTMVRRQYRKVFDDMLAAAKGFAEHGAAPTPLVMMGAGRKLTAVSG